jgi:omega-hydroxy-beta-dihydromenaquinone-9 sulfotransferase
VFINGSNKRLLLKSPVHTGRVDLLRKIFPSCVFVHVHRDPADVIRSSLHMASCYYPSCYLQPTTIDEVVNFTFDQYKLLYRALFASETYVELDSARFVEVSFDELDSSRGSVAHVVNVIDRIYAALDLGKVPGNAIEAFLNDLLIVRQFQKNDHANMLCGKFDERRLQARIDQETAFVRKRYRYQTVTKPLPNLYQTLTKPLP